MNRVVRVYKHERRRERTSISRNESIVGQTIETMVEKIRTGEGEDSIQDRDLVYNDGETGRVNPLTDIRADTWDLRLDEIEDRQAFNRGKMKVVEENNEVTGDGADLDRTAEE